MKAAILNRGEKLLEVRKDYPIPDIYNLSEHKTFILLKVVVCGVCRTDLHILNNELKLNNKNSKSLILGHQIIGKVYKISRNDSLLKFNIGDYVGVPQLGSTCHKCKYCKDLGKENLCDFPSFTGFNINGGFAQYCLADSDYCFKINDRILDKFGRTPYEIAHIAPLFCAGFIGQRSYQKIPEILRKNIGFYGFGSSASILIQVAKHFGNNVYAFTRTGKISQQQFALKLGAKWAGGSDEILADQPLDSAIIFAPIGNLIIQALKSVRKGGMVVCAGIHMSDIPSFPYDLLQGERSIVSVANLTRNDGIQFLNTISSNHFINLQTHVKCYNLENVNQALEDLEQGRLEGSAVIVIANE